MATLAEYEVAIRRGGNTPIAKVEFLHLEDEAIKGNEGTIVGEILGGGITITRNNGARRSVSMQLRNIRGELTPDEDGNIWINSKFLVSLGIRMYNETTKVVEDVFFPQGIFVTRSPQVLSENDGSEISLEGIDKFALFNGQLGGKVDATYIIPVGSDIEVKMRELLEVKLDVNDVIPRDPATPVIPPISAPNNVTPYTIVEERKGNLGNILKEFVHITSRDMYYDRTGRFNFKENIPDIEKGAIWHFTDEDAVYLGSTLTLEFEKVVNKVTVTGANVNGDIAYGEAVNNNLQSSTCVQKIGVKLKDVEISTIDTDAKAQAYAEYLLKFLTVVQNSVSIKCIPMPHLDVDEIIELTDKNLNYVQKRFVITGIDMPFDSEEMILTIVDTDEFIEL